MKAANFNFSSLPDEWKPSDKRLTKFLSFCKKVPSSDCIKWSRIDDYDNLIIQDPYDSANNIYRKPDEFSKRFKPIGKSLKRSRNHSKSPIEDGCEDDFVTKAPKKRFSFNNKRRYVKDIVYTWYTGTITENDNTVNTCGNSDCVYYEHLIKRSDLKPTKKTIRSTLKSKPKTVSVLT